MSSEQVTAGPVELSYTLTEDDLLDGFVAHRRGVRRPWLIPLVIGYALLGCLIGVISTGGFPTTSGVDLAVLAAVAVFAAGFGLVLFRLLVGAHWLYRWQVRLFVRGNPWMCEPIEAAVDDAGLRLRSQSRSESAAWSQYLRYVETERSFVLRASERLGAMVLVLPKRGLVTGDPAPLRALLEAHCIGPTRD